MEWLKRYSQVGPSVHVAFLFCGYMTDGGKSTPQIVKLDSAGNFLYNPISTRGFASTGATQHGAALYLHHRFYRDDPLMSLEQAKLLAYCVAEEVAELDNSVGGPIDLEVITPEGSRSFTDLAKYEAGRQEIVGGVRSFLSRFE